MHVQHARAPGGHLGALAITVGGRTRLGGSRRQPPVLVAGETIVLTGDQQPPADAGGRDLQCGVESGRQMGGQWGGGRGGEGVFPAERGAGQASIINCPSIGLVYPFQCLHHLA